MSEVFLNINKQPIFGHVVSSFLSGALKQEFLLKVGGSLTAAQGRDVHCDAGVRRRLFAREATGRCAAPFAALYFAVAPFLLLLLGSNGALLWHSIVDGALVLLCDHK